MRRMILISAAAFALAGAAHAQAGRQTRHFLKDAMQGDSSEVMLGKLAIAQGDSQAMKSYGQMLVDDHSMHLQKVDQLAGSLKVPTDDHPTPAAEKERDKLMGLHGAAFDRAFARYMAKDHRKMITEFEREAKTPGDVGQMAQQTLPTLHKHLAGAEKLEG